jgi:hypothetical protein
VKLRWLSCSATCFAALTHTGMGVGFDMVPLIMLSFTLVCRQMKLRWPSCSGTCCAAPALMR